MLSVALLVSCASDDDDKADAQAPSTTAVNTSTSAPPTATTPVPSSPAPQSSEAPIDATQVDPTVLAATLQPVADAYWSVAEQMALDPAAVAGGPQHPLWTELRKVVTDREYGETVQSVRFLSNQGRVGTRGPSGQGRYLITAVSAPAPSQVLADYCFYDDHPVAQEGAGTTVPVPKEFGAIFGQLTFVVMNGRWLLDAVDQQYMDKAGTPESCAALGMAP